jgi:hypothetical protein
MEVRENASKCVGLKYRLSLLLKCVQVDDDDDNNNNNNKLLLIYEMFVRVDFSVQASSPPT